MSAADNHAAAETKIYKFRCGDGGSAVDNHTVEFTLSTR